jgi:hypothetical protein
LTVSFLSSFSTALQFSYIVYDLDMRRIVDFRLKPWADRFLILPAERHNDEGETVTDPATLALKLVAEDMHPEGFRHTRVPCRAA